VEVLAGDELFVAVGASIVVAVGIGIGAGVQETNKMATKISNDVFVFIYTFIYTFILPGTAQRFALPALGRVTAKPSNQKNDKA
jgi:hypothetical protein